jgi:hypothetical protein
MNPIQIFFSQKQHIIQNISKKKVAKLQKLISATRKDFINYSILTYKVKTKRGTSDDKVYNENPILLELLPRACSIIIENSSVIGVMEGGRKFSGMTPLDDDVENPGKTLNTDCSNIYNHKRTLSLATKGDLKIIKTSKLNGKNAVMTICKNSLGKLVLVGGSKNFHLVTEVEQFLSPKGHNSFMNMYCTGGIIKKIFIDIYQQLPKILSTPELMDKLVNRGCTLGGELCDGEHFTTGDDRVYWFSMFKGGMALDPLNTLEMLKVNNIPHTGFVTVFDSSSKIEDLDKVFYLARTTRDEGNVLYLINTETNNITLVKSKSSWYIVLRFMRQCIVRGYKCIEDVKKRFVEAADYHGLNTCASIRATKKLMEFGFWMMKKQYPCKVLGHMPVESVKGILKNGFNIYWNEFLNETKENDITFTTDDFVGGFNAAEYINSPVLKIYNMKDITKRPIVVFIQGIQGSGKSSMANHIKSILEQQGNNVLIIEQDQFYGDTNAAQGALYHNSLDENGPNVIIVSRCNVNEKHYRKYTAIAHGNQCKVLFCTPNKIDVNYLLVSLSGLYKRSTKGDNIMIGRFEKPFSEIYEWVDKNFKEFKARPNSILYSVFNCRRPSKILKNIVNLYCNKNIVKFKLAIAQNWEKIDQSRIPIENVCAPIIEGIMNTLNGDTRLIHRNKTFKYGKSTVPVYIGLFIDNETRNSLIKTLFSLINEQPEFKLYCSHLTQHYLNNKGQIPSSRMEQFEQCFIKIDNIVIRKSDNAVALNVERVYRIVINGGKTTHINVSTKNRPHITAYLPNNVNPVESNNFVTEQDSGLVTRIPINIIVPATCLWV